MRGGARRPGARRSLSTLSPWPRAPQKLLTLDRRWALIGGPLYGGSAAVYVENLARDVVGAGGEKTDGCCHVVRVAEPSHWNLGLELLLRLLREVLGHEHGARSDGVDLDPGSQRSRQAPRQHDYSRLGDRVRDIAGPRALCAHVRQIDDAAAAAAHGARRGLRAEERGLDVDGDEPVEVGRRDGVPGSAPEDAGVVDEQVE